GTEQGGIACREPRMECAGGDPPGGRASRAAGQGRVRTTYKNGQGFGGGEGGRAARLPLRLCPRVSLPMPLAFGCATLVLLAGTLLPLAPSDHWMVRGFDFPRLQLLFAALGALGAALLLLDRSALSTRLVLVGLGVVIAWQSWWILPYTPIFPREVLSAPAS